MPSAALALTPVQPREAIHFLTDKVSVTKSEFEALSEEAKARAFTVSGLTRLDLIESVRQSMVKTLGNGTSFEAWKASLPQELNQAGWSDKRLSTVFRTNMQSAYQAGRFAQMSQMTDVFPFWEYDAVMDGKTRPLHAALNGMVYPANHPFWLSWYPPNGFNCRCSVQALTKGQVASRELTVQTEIPEEVDTPHGPVRLISEKGFSGNLGKNWLGTLSPGPLDGDLQFLAERASCREILGKLFAGGDDPCRPPLADLDPRHIKAVDPTDILPKGLAPERYVTAFLEEFGIKRLDDAKIVKLPGVELPVVISKGFFIDKLTGDWKVAKYGREPYVRLLARTIQDPYEIWHVPAKLAGKPMDVLRLIRLFSAGGRKIGGFGVFNLVRGRSWQAATAFTPKIEASAESYLLDYLEKQRVGTLVFREELQ